MCVVCAGELTGRQTRYCSQRCSSKALYQQQAFAGYRQQAHVKAKRNEWANANRVRYTDKRRESDGIYYRTEERQNILHRRQRRTAARKKLARAEAGSSGRYQWTAGPCVICGVSFVDWASSRTCSPACSKRLDYKRNRDRKKSKYRLLRAIVFERDAWTCGICGLPTNPLVRVPHNDAAVLDHVIPRSWGGSDLVDNLQCSHFWCNSVKGAGERRVA